MSNVTVLVYWLSTSLKYPLIQHDYWSEVGCFAYNAFQIQPIFGAILKAVWGFEQNHSLMVC